MFLLFTYPKKKKKNADSKSIYTATPYRFFINEPIYNVLNSYELMLLLSPSVPFIL